MNPVEQASRTSMVSVDLWQWGQQKGTGEADAKIGDPGFSNPWFWETGSKSRYLKMSWVL